MSALAFLVPGIPAPQGSLTRNKWGATYGDNPNTAPWREAVVYAARGAAGVEWVRLEGGVEVLLTFTFVRPKSISAKSRPHMTVKPDIDKLERAVLDALTHSGLWRDDALVVHVDKWKVYGDAPSCWIELREAL